MKWLSLAFAVLGALALGVSGHFWQSLLDSADFKVIFLLSQVQVGGGSSGAAHAQASASGLTLLRTVPWFSYVGVALSLVGAGLVVTKGREAALPLLAASVLLLVPLGWVVFSVPDLAPYLYGELVGVPSLLAGLSALFVKGKKDATSPQSAEPQAAEKQPSAVRKKRLWSAGVAVAALGLLVLLLVAFASRGKADDDELLFYPGPVALTSDEFELIEGSLQVGRLVAAEWDGVWFGARVLSANDGGARVRFIGWGSAWDEELPRDRLRTLPSHLVPQMQADSKSSSGRLGSAQATPCAFELTLYQSEAGLEAVTKLSDLKAQQTLYSPRLDLSDVSLEDALKGLPIRAGKPFALAAVGTLRVKVAGSHHFALTSNGSTRLWIDDQPVSADSPVQLDAGAHDLRVEHRHDGGSSLTLRLQMGTKPSALRPLDLNRDGVAQFAPEGDGLRVVLDESLLFDVDRDNLKPSAERALSSIYARSLAPVPSAPVSIEGHTDATGTTQHNHDLSRRRAESVRDWLSARGRASSHLAIRAYGETRPRVPNDSDDHRRLNRRVELVIGAASANTDPPENKALPTAAALPATGPAPSAAAIEASATATAANANAANLPVLDVLHAYYRELNDGNFDANRYFEPSVERYITMMNTSTAAMNNYIRNIFPKQFKEHHFELEEGSLSQESAGQYLYVERSRYIQAGKTQSVEKRVKVRIRLSPSGKLVFLHQFQRL